MQNTVLMSVSSRLLQCMTYIYSFTATYLQTDDEHINRQWQKNTLFLPRCQLTIYDLLFSFLLSARCFTYTDFISQTFSRCLAIYIFMISVCPHFNMIEWLVSQAFKSFTNDDTFWNLRMCTFTAKQRGKKRICFIFPCIRRVSRKITIRCAYLDLCLIAF